MRSEYFNYNRWVRQGCILSHLLFNLYLNDIPSRLDNTHGSDPITSPNGSRLNLLLYAYDLVLISTSAVGLQRSINSLHQFCKESSMSVNTQKSKVTIFQKERRKCILEKLSFFLDDLQIDNVPSYSYLGSTTSSNGIAS